MPLFPALDLFKSHFVLRFHKNEKVSSNLGLFFSIAITVVLVFYASQSDLFYRRAPKVLDSSTGLDSRRTINFQNKIFAIGVSDDNTNEGLVDPTLFSIDVVNFYYGQDNGTMGRSQKNAFVLRR